MTTLYGPVNPPDRQNYEDNRKRTYLEGYANKIKYDLGRLLGIYSGQRAVIFKLEPGDRCTNCTDEFTGEVLLSNCPVCLGTGFVTTYTPLGETWIGINIGPAQNVALETGATQNPGTKRDIISIVGMPQLHDRDIVILKDMKLVYKIEDTEPDIVGLAGHVIIQNVSATMLEPGNITYSLITW